MLSDINGDLQELSLYITEELTFNVFTKDDLIILDHMKLLTDLKLSEIKRCSFNSCYKHGKSFDCCTVISLRLKKCILVATSI